MAKRAGQEAHEHSNQDQSTKQDQTDAAASLEGDGSPHHEDLGQHAALSCSISPTPAEEERSGASSTATPEPQQRETTSVLAGPSICVEPVVVPDSVLPAISVVSEPPPSSRGGSRQSRRTTVAPPEEEVPPWVERMATKAAQDQQVRRLFSPAVGWPNDNMLAVHHQPDANHHFTCCADSV